MAAAIKFLTGAQCTLPGTYRSACNCQSRQLMSEGLFFPSCLMCGERGEWVLEKLGMRRRSV